MATNDPVEVRIEKMAEWAKSVNTQLADLTARIIPTTEECDAISVELGELYDKYATVRDDARMAKNGLEDMDGRVEVPGLIQIDDELRHIKEQVAPIEAQARLDAFGLNELTGKPCTVKQTDDRAVTALAGNKDYQKLIERRLVLERQKAGLQAILADADSALSEYRNRNRALVARLGNLTARLRG